jgi:hypothetical protein
MPVACRFPAASVGLRHLESTIRAAAASTGLWLRMDLVSRASISGGVYSSITSDEGRGLSFTASGSPTQRTVGQHLVPDFDGTNDVFTGPLLSTILGSLGPYTIEVVFLADTLRASTNYAANGLVATQTSNRLCLTAGSAACYAVNFCSPGFDRVAIPGVLNGSGSAVVPSTGTIYRLRSTFDNSAALNAKLGASSGNYNGTTGAHFSGNYGFAMLLGNTASGSSWHDGAICEVFAIPSVISAALADQRDEWVRTVWGASV